LVHFPRGRVANGVEGASPLSFPILTSPTGTSQETEAREPPKWRQDGRELIFKDGQEAAFAVEVGGSPTFHAGVPELLFRPPIQTVWDITPDGKRFLAAMPVEQAGASSPITVVLNWQEAPKK
jgi:hypothetical protein